MQRLQQQSEYDIKSTLNEINQVDELEEQYQFQRRISFSQVHNQKEDWSPTSQQIEKLGKLDVNQIFNDFKEVHKVLELQSQKFENFGDNQLLKQKSSMNQLDNQEDSDEDQYDTPYEDSDSDSDLDDQKYLKHIDINDSLETIIDGHNNDNSEMQQQITENTKTQSRHSLSNQPRLKVIFMRTIPQNSRLLKTGEEKTFKLDIIDNDSKAFNDKLIYYQNKQQINQLGIGVACKKNSNDNVPNQDDYLIYIDNKTKIYAIFDGHGPYGHIISYLSYKLIFNHLRKHQLWKVDPVKCLQETFEEINKLIKHGCNMIISGCSTTIVIQRDNEAYIASLGDTRAILFFNQWAQNGNKNKGVQHMQLTQLHIPENSQEKMRIYNNLGEVRTLQNEQIQRVFVRGRNYPGLHITRSIGNTLARNIGVNSEPDIQKLKLSQQHNSLLICTQSVTEYLDNEEISSILQSFNSETVKEAQELLTKRVKQAWMQNENTLDDFTFILIYFQ